MPSVLFELGFLILPEYEERFLTPAFQQLVADTLVGSVNNFLNKSKQ